MTATLSSPFARRVSGLILGVAAFAAALFPLAEAAARIVL